MKKKFTVVIFTDLDGSLLHRDTFQFDTIKDYMDVLVPIEVNNGLSSVVY